MGKQFKDLNDNNKLDPYENWQLSVDKRVKDLISQMTLEEKAGLMLISDTKMNVEAAPGESMLVNEDKVNETNIFAKEGDPNWVLEKPVIMTSGAKPGILDRHSRYFIARQAPSADKAATWANQMQEMAEGSRLGVPVVITTNPVHHNKNANTFELAHTPSGPTLFPIEPGLGATQDPELVKEMAETAGEQLASVGMRKIYGYMADTMTDPLWGRAAGTFGEHPELVGEMNKAIVEGYQGETLGKDSVALTVKHFPGGGARDDGKDPHYLDGQFNPYPTEGSLYKYHLPAFQGSIDAGVSSIMPYYAYPSNDASVPQLEDGKKEFEEVGFAYNKDIVDGILRKEMGFKGYINSDTGIIGMMPWGVEDLSYPERYAKAVKSGTSLFGGDGDPVPLIQAVKDGLLDESDLDKAVAPLLIEMMNLGLFEDPYVDPEKALEVANDPAAQELAKEIHRKSIVLLRNDEIEDGTKILPLSDDKIQDVKLYVQVLGGGDNKGYDKGEGADDINTAALKKIIGNYDSSITVTDNIEEATHAFVWVLPLAGMSDPVINIDESVNIDVAKVKEIENKVPTILAVNMNNPWLIDEIEPGADAVISTFNTTADAVIDVLRGKFNPSGKLPVTIPANMKAVENEAGDVPGYAEKDPNYAYTNEAGDKYVSGFGLSFEEKAAEVTFPDVNNGKDWAEPYIEALAKKDIIKGKANGLFAPYEKVTRAQFTAMLVRALDLNSPQYDDKFSDVKGDEWFIKELTAAVDAGLISGLEDGTFAPQQEIKRSEAAVILARAIKALEMDVELNPTKKLADFKDQQKISDWAQKDIEFIYQAGIMNGKADGTFDPNSSTQRNQTAKMLYEFLELQD